MADKFDKKTRSRIMSKVKSKDTSPELRLRKILFRKGLRYRLHNAALPGKPDIVFPKYKAVIFIHGCFWHGHDCGRTHAPYQNQSYWNPKIAKNKERDVKRREQLAKLGWHTLEVWECAIYGKKALSDDALAKKIISWLEQSGEEAEISGDNVVA